MGLTDKRRDLRYSRFPVIARVCYPLGMKTHRPSLLPIERLSESFGLLETGWQHLVFDEKLGKLGRLEEVKVVTRFP